MEDQFSALMELLRREHNINAFNTAVPNHSCGNRECEAECGKVVKIAKNLGVDPVPMVQSAIEKTLASKFGCRRKTEAFSNIGKPIPGCKFGFISLTAFSDNGKKIIARRFCAESMNCKKCAAHNNEIIPIEKFSNNYVMNRYGYWKQSDGIFRPHPHCKCNWVDLVKEDLSTLAAQEKQAILKKAKEENERQKKCSYPKSEACGTQAEELASALYKLNLVCWSPKVVLGTKYNSIVGSILNGFRMQSQHHAVVIISKINEDESFMLDTYFGNVSGKRKFGDWLAEYGMDPVFKFKIEDSNSEHQDQINNDKGTE